MEPLLRADNLVKCFDGNRVVDGISLRVQPGERVGIVGPNGAGKTTTLLMLLGAIDPDEGSVTIAGHELPKGRAAAMAEVGFSAGYLPLPDRLTVREALRFFADLSIVEDPGRAVDEILEELTLGHLAKQRCMTLSSGQATLVGMAKAMLHRPRLVVLDEPTASLDPDVALRVRRHLARLNEEHHTALLLTSHDMREVEELTERVIFMREGEIIANGLPATVVADAGFSTLEEMFLAEAARLKDRLV